ncbi:unnamed protein product [Camellia sinensis]
MQQILPIAVRNLQLCFKTLEVDGLNRLQSQIALTLCHLERIFPPSFFDIMEHLPIHLAEEAKIVGPVQYRWMYFIERYLMTLKSYMRNRSHPEGSIAQGYLVEECMTFCSRYLHDVESKLHRPLRNCDVNDNPEILMGRALGKGKGFVLDNTTWVQAHREHREFIKRSHRRLRDYDVDRRHNDEFPKWFNSHVAELLATENVALSEEIKILALGPSRKATRFNGYIINGTRYHTKSCELRRKTQNSGVMVKAKTSSYASAKDINPVEGPSSSQATQKQTRGPTYVHGQWGTSEDGILKVVPNELNQVVEGHTSLASHLGVLARDGSLAPLTFTTWHYVPKQNKDNIWREIKAHTDADESMKRTIMASFGKKWRDWKSRVKTMGYKPFKNDAERLAHRPDRVHEDQWRALVYYWGTQSASKSSKKNRKIRKKKTLHHRTGRKPFSVVRLEETKKNNGVPASRSQVWMAAYMKDGTSNSDSVNEVMTQMNELAEHMEGSSTDPAALQEQIFTQIMGPERPGRVRTFGLGPSPTDVFGGGYRRSQEQNRLFQTQVQEQVQEQLQRYQMQFESKMNEVMEKQIQAIRTDFQSRIQFLESQLQAAGVPVDPVVAPSNPLHRQQVVDSLSSHPTVRPMSHQQQSHAFSSQERRRIRRRRRRTNKLLPSFSGNVPGALKDIFPSANITRLGDCRTLLMVILVGDSGKKVKIVGSFVSYSEVVAAQTLVCTSVC